MLALVKKPHIELSIQGEHVSELVAWIRKKYDVAVLADEPEDGFVSIESTEYWKEMEKNRVGNLLAGARPHGSGEHDVVSKKIIDPEG
jgi:hypothetical protein